LGYVMTTTQFVQGGCKAFLRRKLLMHSKVGW
jgi:hypothetical protein